MSRQPIHRPRKIEEFACEGCFQDEALCEWIRENGEPGPCQWCRSRRRHRVPLEELRELFRDVVDIYSPCGYEYGELVSRRLQHDWSIFSEKLELAPDDRMQDLAISILYAGVHPKDDVDAPDYRGFFANRDPVLEDEWHERVADLLRPTPPAPAPAPSEIAVQDGDRTLEGEPELEWEYDRIQFAIEDRARAYEVDHVLYRARIHKDRSRRTRFAPDELGAPPPEKARAGRANREGEPALYVASDEQTALAEVRAWKGAAIAVGRMRILRPLRILDLSCDLWVRSPFFHEDLNWTLETMALFRRFAEEMSRPILPGEKLGYVPSQHVCEVARSAGYDGIAYPSAMGPGHNVVLFDPAASAATEVRYYRAVGVQYQVADFGPYETLYDDWPYEHE